MTGRWIRQVPAEQVVVFVHGVLSSGESCWRNEASGAYWPQLVADADEDPALGAAIYVATYRTGLDSAKYGVNDAAEALWEELHHAGVLERGSIVLVCHSMGGLVVRRMLVQRQGRLGFHRLGLFLVASPSLGSRYANWLAPIARLFGHAQAESLRLQESNPWLETLDADFLDLLDRTDLAGRELVEDRSIFGIGPWQGEPIVSPLSARRYFRDGLKIPDSDHFSIAKPADAQALQHLVLMEFIRLRREAPRGSTMRGVSPEAADTRIAPVASASEFLEHPNLADLLCAADEDSLGRLVAAVPRGAGISMAFVPDRFRRHYLAATTSADIHDRVAAASALVRPTFPTHSGRYETVTVVAADLLEIGQKPRDVLREALTTACLKGPRMLAAMIVEAPQPALVAARDEVDRMLRALLKGEAS